MQKLPNGDLIDLPTVRPPSADPNNYHDTLMRADHLNTDEINQLIGVLDNYID